ncbi:MAG: hypothetical protein Q8O37_11070 [Sulfuricellaceae bacterium]|nr:hypothetical protein [Sulfuricellaceae bacterium]
MEPKKPVDQQTSTEQQTRSRLIDQDLARAGWSASRRTLIEEFVLAAQQDSPILGTTPEYADYALLGADSKPIAIVEAKRSSRDELAGKRQASDYADRIKARHTQAEVEHFVANFKDGLLESEPKETLINSSSPRRRGSRLLILLDSRLRGSDEKRINQRLPNHEVHCLLGDALLKQARLAAWQTELGLVS